MSERLCGRPSGCYRIAGLSPAVVSAASGFRLTTLDGSGVVDKPGFLARMASALAFPSWFGMNWDALADVLGERWGNGAGEVLTLDGFSGLARAAPDDWASACAVLGAAATESQSSWVLVTGSAGRGLPPLVAPRSRPESDNE